MSVEPLYPRGREGHSTYVVAGGNHVTIELDRGESGGTIDAIEVLALPGGDPPPHRHAFGEWFVVREGALTLCEERRGVVEPTVRIEAGSSVWVPPWTFHGTLNLSGAPVRFGVVAVPGSMSGYFAEVGIPVADEGAPARVDPPGPTELGEIAARWGIEFWTGPVAEALKGPERIS